MDSTVLSVVRCADFYSLWTKCGLLGRPVSVVSWGVAKSNKQWVGTCLYHEECKLLLINCGAVIWCRAT